MKNNFFLSQFFAKPNFVVLVWKYFEFLASSPQNGQTHSNNSSAVVDELFEFVWPFCKVGAERVNFT